MRKCEVRDIGRVEFRAAFELQRELAEQRKRGSIPDQLLFVEHPHTITQGRNGRMENVLGSEAALESAGIVFYETDRGGDVTYHGPGQVVGYPIVDLREWKRDVGAYVRALEQVQIDALEDFGIRAERVSKCTGVWVDGAKIGAIGVHLSRWVSSHGFALNVNTDLDYFKYIVPCGLMKPVTSMQALGIRAGTEEVKANLARYFGRAFEREMEWAESLAVAG
jgi:lipoyl(octanoyl) transferase